MAASATPHLQDWDPALLLQVKNPQTSSICCVGYAKTRGRRCQVKVAKSDIALAEGILGGLPTICTDRRQLRSQLHDLATLLLCKRFHQAQAEDIAGNWYKTIRAEVRRRDGRASEGPSPLAPGTQTAQISSTSEISGSRRSVSAAAGGGPNETGVARSQSSNSPVAGQSPRVTTAEQNETRQQEIRRQRREARQRVDAVQQEVAHHRAEEIRRAYGPQRETLRVVERSQHVIAALTEERDSEARPAAQRSQAQPEAVLAVRQAMDEDCPICLEAFDDDNEAVWCRSSCGKNIHRACFDIWAAHQHSAEVAVTCPYCRAGWLEESHVSHNEADQDTATHRNEARQHRHEEDRPTEAGQPITHGQAEQEANGDNSRHAEGDCPICYGEFDAREEIVWCRAACGNSLHRTCLYRWAEAQQSMSLPVSCPFCRTPWQFDDGHRLHQH